MKLVAITHRDPWEAFQASQPFAQLLQSWAWGDFRMSQGSEVRRFMLLDERSAPLAAIQMERRTRRFGIGYWFAPRGPVFSSALSLDARRGAMMGLCEELLKLPELRRKTLFWRMEPLSGLGEPEGLIPLSFRRTSALDPASTIVMDLKKSEEELLRGMHEKTRYNIRLAERNGVVVRRSSSVEDLNTFLVLEEETAKRDAFVQHSSPYLSATFNALAAHGMATIRIAELEKRPLAAQMEISYGDTVTYLYGASSSESRNVMAPYALQWNAMTAAKSRGFTTYDLWGANPEFKGMFTQKPSWEGITRFKRGFGGRQVDLVGTWDLPLMPRIYSLVNIRGFFRD